MLGLLLTAIFSIGAMGLALHFLLPWLPSDPAAKLGISGIIGLGSFGTLTFLIGQLPSGLSWGVGLFVLGSLYGWTRLVAQKSLLGFTKPQSLDLLFPVAIGAFALISMIGVLSPSTALDWDSLAYHLAVPKIWLAAGQVQFISFIHHSNFPPAVDALFNWGLLWGGQAGAKAFTWMFLIFGALAIFGLSRSRSNATSGSWAALAFVSIPVVCWESGTAYIDVAHGLFAGLGIWFGVQYANRKEVGDLALAALLLGLAVGSKYTGGVTFFLVFGYIVVDQLRSRSIEWKPVLIAIAAAGIIASPAYIRNIINTGNPVYPFMYSKLGGKNWDAFSDLIYREEQATFGVGREVPAEGQSPLEKKPELGRTGASILGLAYQPGRFTNPRPLDGQGFPFQALGFVPLGLLAILCFSGRLKKESLGVVALVMLSLLAWSVLSQQSRYINTIAIPLLLLIGDLPNLFAKAIRGAIAIQAILTAYIMQSTITGPQLQALTGKSSATVSFSDAATFLNQEAKGGKVALYNEVFGFLLDVPYFWANPGHTTEIGYEKLEDGRGLTEALKRLGCTYVYLNLASDPDKEKIFQSMQAPDLPYSPNGASDLRVKWKVLLVQAVQKGYLQPIKVIRSGVIFKITGQ